MLLAGDGSLRAVPCLATRQQQGAARSECSALSASASVSVSARPTRSAGADADQAPPVPDPSCPVPFRQRCPHGRPDGTESRRRAGLRRDNGAPAPDSSRRDSDSDSALSMRADTDALDWRRVASALGARCLSAARRAYSGRSSADDSSALRRALLLLLPFLRLRPFFAFFGRLLMLLLSRPRRPASRPSGKLPLGTIMLIVALRAAAADAARRHWRCLLQSQSPPKSQSLPESLSLRRDETRQFAKLKSFLFCCARRDCVPPFGRRCRAPHCLRNAN